MLNNPASKYRAFAPIALRDRTWPDTQLTHAPRWLSTDLRDGNQALIEPMDLARKLRMFELLVRIGFKEIEVGFPAASQVEWDFVRQLIEEGRIPEDVTIQVMTPAREELIERTVQSLAGARRAIVHVYNAVAPVWREVVFGMSVAEVMALVEQHVRQVRTLTDARPETEWVLQYSPETFSLAELEVSLEACETAIAAWGPGRPIILNLPTTVEAATPNIFADQIEWMARRFADRPEVVLSVHPHNDRGTGTAAAELALMAGAQRVEGCLFGNGERTGNLDIVNVALNLYVQGVAPQLDFSDIDAIRAEAEHCNQLPVPARHPYAGDLVYTSFSGSHQDAIKKAFATRRAGDVWAIPYLPIDPQDLGRSYEAVIRVNSQSGKGGISYLLEAEYGVQLPRRLQIEFSQVVQRTMDVQGKELAGADLWRLLCDEYGLESTPDVLQRHIATREDAQGVAQTELRGSIQWQGRERVLQGCGNGPIDAFVNALGAATGHGIRVLDYQEHAIGGTGSVGGNARAAAYVELRVDEGQQVFGVGMDHDILSAALRAVTSGVLRATRSQARAAAPQEQDNPRQETVPAA
ncbi:2-isopropylmalate synthase [Melaminivora jejuensis]|uniref:2-isopropylmalate synthase n=1 Tax=Melaminivora jejuensis TaxID=1267217 RepID=UPI001ADFBEEF|nr:2-isopropylmalate synthase [Melaminivora jejuensis]UHJ66280.1 2-isopropylmalate synthase [Melaminivora jejuensis]